jgi:hypothetical protein
MSMKNSSNSIGIRTRDLLACSVVPQPTEPPRALLLYVESNFKIVAKGCLCPISGTAVEVWTKWSRQAKLQLQTDIWTRTSTARSTRTHTQLTILLPNLAFSKIFISQSNFLIHRRSVWSITLHHYAELFPLKQTSEDSRLVGSGYVEFLYGY